MAKSRLPIPKSNAPLTRSELKQLRGLNTPVKIQSFLDKIPYHVAETQWSPRMVLQEKTAHCLEGAIFAAAALRINGYPPLIFDMEAVNDSDHVLAIYQENGAWGAIGSSNYSGCRFRSPVYRSLRELALSYFEDYFNLRGERTLRTFSKPVNLERFDSKHWMTTFDSITFIAEHLVEIPHTKLLTPGMEKKLSRLDRRSFEAGLHGYRKK